MKIEVLVATMHQKDHSIVERMNIQTNCVVVNQSDKESYEQFELNENSVKFISNTERGLSRSRNTALKHASGDICIIADDDVIYYDDYARKVREAYKALPNADIIIFDVPKSDNLSQVKFGNDIMKFNFRKAMQINSVRITFKLASIKNKGISFNNIFGTGSIYSHGEENIFIKECWKKGLKIYYYPERIAEVNDHSSSWFNGYSREYFFNMGAVHYELFGEALYFLSATRLLLKKRNDLKEINIKQGMGAILAGKKDYKKRKRGTLDA